MQFRNELIVLVDDRQDTSVVERRVLDCHLVGMFAVDAQVAGHGSNSHAMLHTAYTSLHQSPAESRSQVAKSREQDCELLLFRRTHVAKRRRVHACTRPCICLQAWAARGADCLCALFCQQIGSQLSNPHRQCEADINQAAGHLPPPLLNGRGGVI